MSLTVAQCKGSEKNYLTKILQENSEINRTSAVEEISLNVPEETLKATFLAMDVGLRRFFELHVC